MTRFLCRQHIPWRSLGLVVAIAIITLMGTLTVQNHQCTVVTLDDDQMDNSLISDTLQNVQPSWLVNKTLIDTTNTMNSRYLYFSSELLVQNVSKIENEWFKIIQEEDYLEKDKGFFVTNQDIKNDLNYKYIISGNKICTGNAPFLLVIIPSVVDNVELRDAIRWTWLRAAETNSWPRATIKYKIKHIFLFGLREDQQWDDYQQLIHESKSFGDIVLADFIDTYRNLTRKVIAGLNWVHQYCRNAQYTLKVDEDTFVNVPLMIEVLNHVAMVSKNDIFITGLQHTYLKPIVVREGRWGVSKTEYPLDFYPSYLYGHLYVLSKQALLRITDVAQHVNLISPEDAFITGILPKVANVSRITAPSFTVCCRDIYDCEVVWNERVALPEIKSSKLLVQLWTNVITHSCTSTAPFFS